MRNRVPLTRGRIVDAAVRVADRGGLAEVSMRNVGRELGVEAMSLYHHLAGKDALLDELANWVFTLIELPQLHDPWRPAMADRATSARAALAAHPWALGLIESRRAPGPALLRHHDTVLGCLRTNGFSIDLAMHAFSAIDAYVYGFVLTELNLPFAAGDRDGGNDDRDDGVETFVAEIADRLPASEYPHMVELIAAKVMSGAFDYGDEFAFGLDLILDRLAQLREMAPG